MATSPAAAAAQRRPLKPDQPNRRRRRQQHSDKTHPVEDADMPRPSLSRPSRRHIPCRRPYRHRCCPRRAATELQINELDREDQDLAWHHSRPSVPDRKELPVATALEHALSAIEQLQATMHCDHSVHALCLRAPHLGMGSRLGSDITPLGTKISSASPARISPTCRVVPTRVRNRYPEVRRQSTQQRDYSLPLVAWCMHGTARERLLRGAQCGCGGAPTGSAQPWPAAGA